MNTFTIIIVMGLLFYMATCWAIIDIAGKNFESIIHKAMWGFITLLPFIGIIIYLIFGTRKGQKRKAPAQQE